MTKKRQFPKYCASFVDRHGKERFTFRRAGQKPVYLKEAPGTPRRPTEEYKALLKGAKPEPAIRAAPGTINYLVARFYSTSAFLDVAAETRRTRRGILERFRRKHGDKRVETVEWDHIEAILRATAKKRKEGKRMVGGKVAARSLRKMLVRMFKLAVKLDMIEKNPAELADNVKLGKDDKGGFHTWSEPEIKEYQARHPLGTMARLACEIILWTGQRRADAHLFGRKHLRGGKINYQQSKGGKDLWLPAAPQLLEAIAAMPVTSTDTFLVTSYGKPFSRAGFGNKMRQWCDEAGLPHCSAHGLRKALGRRLADDGATQPEIKAAGGWSNDQEVAIYTAAADQRRLADRSLGGLAGRMAGKGDE